MYQVTSHDSIRLRRRNIVPRDNETLGVGIGMSIVFNTIDIMFNKKEISKRIHRFYLFLTYFPLI